MLNGKWRGNSSSSTVTGFRQVGVLVLEAVGVAVADEPAVVLVAARLAEGR